MALMIAEMVEIATEERLDEYLFDLNESGVNPTVVGFDRHNIPFLAYGFAPGGDGWASGVMIDDPYFAEGDYYHSELKLNLARCPDCGAWDRMPLAWLNYPVRVVRNAR